MLESDLFHLVRRMDNSRSLSSRKQCWPQASKLRKPLSMILDPLHSWWIFLRWPMKHNTRGYSAHDFRRRPKLRNSSFARRYWWTCWVRKNCANRNALQEATRFLRHLRNYQRHIYERRPTHSHACPGAAGGSDYGGRDRRLSAYRDSRRCFNELVGD